MPHRSSQDAAQCVLAPIVDTEPRAALGCRTVRPSASYSLTLQKNSWSLKNRVSNISPSMAHCRMYTTKETAAILNVSTKTIRRMVKDGSIDCLQLTPQLWRYPKEHIDNYYKVMTS